MHIEPNENVKRNNLRIQQLFGHTPYEGQELIKAGNQGDQIEIGKNIRPEGTKIEEAADDEEMDTEEVTPKDPKSDLDIEKKDDLKLPEGMVPKDMK